MSMLNPSLAVRAAQNRCGLFPKPESCGCFHFCPQGPPWRIQGHQRKPQFCFRLFNFSHFCHCFCFFFFNYFKNKSNFFGASQRFPTTPTSILFLFQFLQLFLKPQTASPSPIFAPMPSCPPHFCPQPIASCSQTVPPPFEVVQLQLLIALSVFSFLKLSI